MCVHERVAHRGPVIEPMVEIAGSGLFLVVATAQRRIEGRDRPLDGGPLLLAVAIFGRAGLQAALVGVRPRISGILLAVRLGKEQAKADTAGDSGVSGIEPPGARDHCRQVDHVLERRIGALRTGGRRLHDVEQRLVLVEQRLIVGIEIGRRDSQPVGPSDPRRQRIGEILVGAHHLDTGQIDRLARQVRQRLPGIDLRAALAHDRDEILQRIVVGLERGRLLAREGGWLSNGRTRRNRRKQQSERERRGARSGRYPDRHPDCHDGFPRPVRHRIRHPGS